MPKVTVYVIDNGVGHYTNIESDDNGTYVSALQTLVGGNIEQLDVAFESKPFFVLNEMGALQQRPNCAFLANARMESAGYLSQITREPVLAGELYTLLFGPIVLMSLDSVDEDGNASFRDITAPEVLKAWKQLLPLGPIVDEADEDDFR